jgi:hypothetical protein
MLAVEAEAPTQVLEEVVNRLEQVADLRLLIEEINLLIYSNSHP